MSSETLREQIEKKLKRLLEEVLVEDLNLLVMGDLNILHIQIKEKFKMDKWINFHSEKPKKNGEYLCYHRVSKWGNKETWKRSILYWEDNLWLYDPRYFSTADFVNYWMPLPEIPNEDNKE